MSLQLQTLQSHKDETADEEEILENLSCLFGYWNVFADKVTALYCD